LEKKTKKKKIQHFRALDGVYGSYWLGKFINLFVLKGKKKLISKSIYSSLFYLKISHRISPVLHLLHVIEQIKPMFTLINIIRHKKKKKKKRVIITKYPKAIGRKRQYLVALK